MLGVLSQGQERMKAEQVNILGLRVLWVSVPMGGYGGRRRVNRAARLLTRNGVRRLLPTREDLGCKTVLQDRGLVFVEPLPLYRAMGAELTLALLKSKGVEPERGAAALVGESVDGELAAAARRLCPLVRTLQIRVARGGERLARELYREFGAAVALGGEADVQVRFSGPARPGELVLCGVPELLGLEPELTGAKLPEQLEPMSLLTALWQGGRIGVKDLYLREKNDEFGCKKMQNML